LTECFNRVQEYAFYLVNKGIDDIDQVFEVKGIKRKPGEVGVLSREIHGKTKLQVRLGWSFTVMIFSALT
jgi:hypothetical protein